MVLEGIAECMRTHPLVACEVLLGFPPLDLWIRKMTFKAACRLQSHNSNGGLMNWELVKQLELYQTAVQKDGFSKNLIPLKDWFGSWMAPKPKEALGPRLGDRAADSKWSANSTHMPRFLIQSNMRSEGFFFHGRGQYTIFLYSRPERAKFRLAPRPESWHFLSAVQKNQVTVAESTIGGLPWFCDSGLNWNFHVAQESTN